MNEMPEQHPCKSTAMKTNYISDRSFSAEDFTAKKIPHSISENCIFRNCDFSYAKLSELSFIDCEFIGCDLSMADVSDTTFRDSEFSGCKIRGVQFEHCRNITLSFSFENCHLGDSSFNGLRIPGTVFSNCRLIQTDFTECDLAGASFNGCDLSGAVFRNTVLEKADFRESFNFSIDPDQNRIRKAKFPLSGLPGLLDKYGILIDKNF